MSGTWPWSSSAPAAAPPAPEGAPGESGGLLGYFRSGLSGYVPLHSAERSNEEEAYLSLSHWERYVPISCALDLYELPGLCRMSSW